MQRATTHRCSIILVTAFLYSRAFAAGNNDGDLLILSPNSGQCIEKYRKYVLIVATICLFSRICLYSLASGANYRVPLAPQLGREVCDFMGRTITTINALLIAFYGAFFMNVWYSNQCELGQCPWMKERAPISDPATKIRKL